jgi:hypothetical protein
VLWDGELLEESIGFVMGGLGMLAGGTGVAELLHKGPKVGPDIFLSDYHDGLVLSGMPREDVIMFVLEVYGQPYDQSLKAQYLQEKTKV